MEIKLVIELSANTEKVLNGLIGALSGTKIPVSGVGIMLDPKEVVEEAVEEVAETKKVPKKTTAKKEKTFVEKLNEDMDEVKETVAKKEKETDINGPTEFLEENYSAAFIKEKAVEFAREHGKIALTNVFSDLGIAKLSDLDEENFGDFIAILEKGGK